MLGSGIFVLPGIAAEEAGPWVMFSYLLAGLLVLPAVLSKAEMATAMPVAGGTYVYIERSMGPWMGTIAGLGTWAALIAKTAFATKGLGSYLVLFAPDSPTTAVAVAVLIALLLLNVVGVGKATLVQIAIVVGTICALLILSVFGAGTARPELLTPAFPHGSEGVITGAGLVFVSYAGVTKICSVAEEVRDPARTLPMGMLTAQLTVMVLYALVSWVVTANVPLAQLQAAHDVTPIATVAGVVFGPLGGQVFAIVAILGLVSMCNAGILSSSRFPFAMSRDGLLPAALQRVSQRFGSPTLSIALTGAVLLVLVTTLPVYELAKLASALQIFIFCIVNLGVLLLRESGARWYRPTFLAPGYPLVQLVGILGGIWLLYGLGHRALQAAFLAVTVGSAWYFYYIRGRIQRRSLLHHVIGEPLVAAAQTHDEAGEVGRDEVHGVGARLVVPVFGDEPAPERLVWLAASFLDEGKLDILRLEEVPDQTALGAHLKLDRQTANLAEESRGYGEALHLDVDFLDIVTHNAKSALQDHVIGVRADWVVMEWPQQGELRWLLRHPMAWWTDNAVCDLAVFLDRGGAFDGDPRDDFPRLLVYATPGPYDSLLMHVAIQLCRCQHDGEITVIGVAQDEDEAEQLAGYHEQLASMCGMPVSSEILRAADPTEAIAEASAGYDLLLIEAGPEHTWRNLFLGDPTNVLALAAQCSVLKLKAPRHAVHAWVRPPGEDHDEVTLAHLADALIVAGLQASRRSDLFSSIARALSDELDLPASELEASLWEREQAQTTGLPEGIAVSGVIAQVEPRIGLFQLASPVAFPGGARVDVVIVVIAASDQRGLQVSLIDRLARATRGPALEALRAATSTAEIHAVLQDQGGWSE